MDDQNLIFLSYSSPDRETVLSYYEDLTRAGYNVWMDKHRLKGGQNWDFEIKRALQKAAIIVVFLSHNSVDRRGYAQREIKIALDQAYDRLVDDIYVIPVLLNRDVAIPEQLARIQAIGVDEGDSKAALQESIAHQLEAMGVETAKAQAEANLRWTMTTHRDAWDGLPGYEASYQLPHFTSAEYPHVSEITDVVRGMLQMDAMAQRQVKFDQSPDLFNFGEDRFRRQNTWEASCGEPIIQGRALSLVYSVWWYAAKAAHPNQHFSTFCFTLDPVTRITSLQEIFTDTEKALGIIQKECREQLLNMKFEEMTNDGSALKLEKNYVDDGTKHWDCFQNFALKPEGIDILFSTYQVAAYAFGPQFVHIPYVNVAPLLRKEMACLLDIEHLQYDTPEWPFAAAMENAVAEALRDEKAAAASDEENAA